jgi:hypothetical protein
MQFNIEYIKKIKKSETENYFVNGLLKVLSIVVYPIEVFGGLLFMLLLIVLSLWQKLTSTKAQRQADKIDEIKGKSIENQWTILTETNRIKLYQQYSGEIRFGPVYLKLKSNPHIGTLNGSLFGDWFFYYQNGIFLQQWNSTENANTNLMFVNTDNFEAKVIIKNIPSVYWKIVEKENKNFELICDTGKEILTYKINSANKYQ